MREFDSHGGGLDDIAKSFAISLVFALSFASLTLAAPADRIAAPIDPSHSAVIPNHVRTLAAS